MVLFWRFGLNDLELEEKGGDEGGQRNAKDTVGKVLNYVEALEIGYCFGDA